MSTEGPPNKRGRGRPPLLELNPELASEIIQGIRAGLFPETACHLAGVAKSSFTSWMTQGRRGESKRCVDFLASVKKALAESEALHIQNIYVAAQTGVWQASAWYLERKSPDRWGRERQTKAEAKAKAELLQLQAEKIRAEIEALKKKSGDDSTGVSINLAPEQVDTLLTKYFNQQPPKKNDEGSK